MPFLFRRNIRKFTSPESFHLFMDGIRALHQYEDEASKESPAFPDRDQLKKSLLASANALGDAVVQFPKDLLPRYYSAILLTMRAQHRHAEWFEELLKREYQFQELSRLPDEVSELLKKAAREFAETARRAGGGELQSYALYNQAQALARLDDAKQWDHAREILEHISPDPLDRLPTLKQITAVISRWLRGVVNWGILRLDTFRDRVEGSTGIPAAVAAAVTESEAMKLQIAVAYYFTAIREEARRGSLLLVELPQTQGSETAQFPHFPSQVLSTLWLKVQKASIPSKARSDIEADYWNKWAFVAWERALAEQDGSNRKEWLNRTHAFLGRTRHDSWTPWQMNMVRFFLTVGDHARAREMLSRILGVSQPMAKPAMPPDLSATVADVITKMAAQQADPIPIAGNLRRAYPELSQQSIQKIIEQLAGKVSPALIDQIFRQYSGCK